MKRALICLCAALGVLLAGLSACADSGALLLTRDFSSRYAAGDGWITLSYTLRNVSQKNIGEIELFDPLLGEDQPEPIDGLAPGESRAIVARARIMAFSSPVFAFRPFPGGSRLTYPARARS